MKKFVVLVSVGVVLVAAAVLSIMSLMRESDPKVVVLEALQGLNDAQSFRYSFLQQEINGAQERLLADLKGEKNGKDVSLKGKVAGNEVEMLCIGDDFFNRDLLNQKWVQYPGIANTVIQQLFPVEFNPSTLVEFDETSEVVLNGQEVVNGEKCKVFQLTPKINSDSLNREWKNFSAAVSIGKSSDQVVRIVLSADHVRKERKLRLTLDFRDMGLGMSIDRP